jgi:hypothetical protein
MVVDFRGAVSKAVLILIYIGSATISGFWFWRELPGLLMDPARFPTLAPAMSALFGVAIMELAVIAWNYKVKRDTGVEGAQRWVAWFGLIAAISMSGLTTFAAVMSFIGSGSDLVGGYVVEFATQNGMAYYTFLQILLVALFSFVFDPDTVAQPERPRKATKPGSVTTISSPQRSQASVPRTTQAPDFQAILGVTGAEAGSRPTQAPVSQRPAGGESRSQSA